MPLLSVVLVVRRHQAYVRACVRSILDQGFGDVEVVVVDDASADHAPTILAELASTDDRVRVRRLGTPHGLGQARDIGLDRATGDYVWFMEASDYLEAGVLHAVAEQLSRTEPDVLLVDHIERDVLGEVRSQPADGRLPGRLGNLVIRRSHLRSIDVRFGGGACSHVAVAYLALMTAQRIARLDSAGYVHRRLPKAVRKQWSEGSASDVFEQYDRVFELIDRQPIGSDGERRTLLRTMLRHYTSLLDALPPARRQAFFAQMSGSYMKHRRGVQAFSGGRRLRLEVAAVEHNSFRAYRVLRWADGRRAAWGRRLRRAHRRLRRGRVRLRSWMLRRYYAIQRRRPMDDRLAVFAAYWYAAYSCNPRAIYEEARRLAPWLQGVWVVNSASRHVIPPDVRYVVAGSRDYYRTMARATYFVNNVNFPNDITKRSGQIHLQTHHGTPLKTMGTDLADAAISRSRLNFPRLIRRVGRWDYSISANSFTTEIWERVYPSGTYESLETGYPRNDALANANDDDVARRRARLGIEPGQKAVLYAPTHREYTREFEPLLDVAALAEQLGPDYVIMMRTHYFYASRPAGDVQTPTGRVIDVAAHPSIEDLALASDVLVTDYSSLMFDYAVLDRPIVIYAPDWEVYRTMRGTYFDLMAEPPGAVTTTEAELADVLRSERAWDDENAALRKVFRTKYCALEDGRAAERVVRRLWPDPRGPASAGTS